MNRDPIQRRNRFWIWWILFSMAHLLTCGSIIFCIIVLTRKNPPLAGEALTFTHLAGLYTLFCMNPPVWLVHSFDLLLTTPVIRSLQGAMIILDSILCGLGFASVFWLARCERATRSRYLGFTPQVVGRGLIVAMVYFAISFLLEIVKSADAHALLSSQPVWQDEIDGLLRIMHPLVPPLGIGVKVQIDKGLQYMLVMMLDSALIGVLFMWVWTWFLSSCLAGRRNRRAV